MADTGNAREIPPLHTHICGDEHGDVTIWVSLPDLIVMLENYKEHVKEHKRVKCVKFAAEVVDVIIEEFMHYNENIHKVIERYRHEDR